LKFFFAAKRIPIIFAPAFETSFAGMAELVDAYVSGAYASNGVRVRLSLPAQTKGSPETEGLFCFWDRQRHRCTGAVGEEAFPVYPPRTSCPNHDCGDVLAFRMCDPLPGIPVAHGIAWGVAPRLTAAAAAIDDQLTAEYKGMLHLVTKGV